MENQRGAMESLVATSIHDWYEAENHPLLYLPTLIGSFGNQPVAKDLV